MIWGHKMTKFAYPSFNNRAILSWLDEEQMLELFDIRCRQYGTQKAFAASMDISEVYTAELLKKRKPVSHTVARKMGYKKIAIYIPNPTNNK